MNAIFPALINFAGLGSFISRKHFASANSATAPHLPDDTPDMQKAGKPAVGSDPIDRSRANTRRNRPEAALARFAPMRRVAQGLKPPENVEAEVRTIQARNRDVCNSAASGAVLAALFPNTSSQA
jgi:hypothetical protein